MNSSKYLFYFSAILLLVVMLFAGKSAGISCDEVIHYNHSVEVYNYYASHGADKSALKNDPATNLNYYGQSCDNIVTILEKWFNVEDVYTFRNLMSSFIGWLAILITALFAIWLKNYRTGMIVLFLFAISPTFIGHSYNNLKDIPFAFAYIAGIFFIFKNVFRDSAFSWGDSILLTLSIAFCISLRAGGLILIFYLYLFLFICYSFKFSNEKINIPEITRRLVWATGISLVGFLLSAVLWPYALQNPFRNIPEAYRVMAHYPLTFRQIFEGKTEWSDSMPWYYLVKSMLITIPLAILSGLLIFIFYTAKIFTRENLKRYGLLLFTVIFPVVFVIIEKSNLYSSWRQFLFIYPVIILLASIGFAGILDIIQNKYLKVALMTALLLMSINPVSFMIRNHPYEYIYYNELAGGLRGAYGNYETDYYYVSQGEASKWLLDYLEKNKTDKKIKVMATYSIGWFFRNHPEIETSWFRYEERSMVDWDYAIVGNRYISPYMLKHNLWPPENAIHIIYADDIPIGAVLERKTKDDLNGYQALSEGRYADATEFFEKAVKKNDDDEMIFYNFAGALLKSGRYREADSVLKKGLMINPDSELILMYLGNIAKSDNKNDDAMKYYEKVIAVNRKYYEAYVSLAGLMDEKDVLKARSLLRECLTLNPGYKPAIIALGDTYRNSDPEIARKYYYQAGVVN